MDTILDGLSTVLSGLPWAEALSRGGVLMVPLVACSVLAVAVVLERATRLRRSAVLRPTPARAIAALRGGDDTGAAELARPELGPVARILNVALDHADAPRELLTEAVRDAARREVQRLEERLGLLAMIGSVAPLLGLLGTVLGMIGAFDALYLGSLEGGAAADPTLLAGGISEALFTTGAGLTVAIPALLAHHLFLGRVDRLATDLEECAIEIVRELTRRARSGAAATHEEAGGESAVRHLAPRRAARAAG